MLISLRRQIVFGLVAVMLVGLLPGVVLAKVDTCSASISPSSMSPGTDTDLTVNLTNISGPDIVWVQLVRPNAGYSVNAASSGGWDATVNASSAVLTGGDLPGDGRMTIDMNVHAAAWWDDPANWTVRVSDSSYGANATDCSGARSTTIQTYLAPDNAGAGISNVAVDVAATSVVVHWNSDVATGSGVRYGLTSDYGASTAYDPALVTHHDVSISGLEPETTYHFQVGGLDSGNAPYFSGDSTFLTLAAAVVRGGPGGGGSGATPSPTPASGAAPRGTIAINAVPTETVPPTVSLDTRLDRPLGVGAKLSGTAGDNVAVARVDYSLDGGKNWIVVESPPGLGSKSVRYAFAPTAEDGNYSLVVRATDTSGNVATTKPATLVIDRLPPRMSGELVSVGAQVLAPEADGRWRAAVGVDQTVTMSAVGGPVTAVIGVMREGMTAQDASRAVQSFTMRRDPSSGLWAGVMSFERAGTYHLMVTAVDGAGTRVVRALPDVVVAPTAQVVAGSGSKGVAGAQVTLYYKQADTGRWLPWDGGAYGQVNPQRTRQGGWFALFVPKGAYYLRAEASGYQPLVTREFTVDRPTALTPTLVLNARPTIYLGHWSLALPWPSLARVAVRPSGDDKVAAGGAGNGLVGHALPSFRLPTTAGDTATPITLEGKPTVVSVLATWAPSTAEQLPALNTVRQHPEVAVMPLYLGEHIGKVQATLARANYNLPAIVDGDAMLTNQLGVPNMPTHYIIDRTGKVKAVLTGVVPAERLLSELKALE